MKKLLITGFEPFDGQSINPSWEAVKLLPDRIGNFELCKLQIPTLYGEAARLVLAEAAELCPQVIISIGQAGKRDAVTPERIAVNIRDARIADNGGVICSGQRIDPEGPAAYFSKLPVEPMAEAIRNARIPGAVSNTAGTYVCNDVMYTLLRHYDGTDVRAGFIHVPWLPEQGSPSLELERTVKALTAAIAVL